MLSLSDDELQILFDLARPLEPALRDPFLRACAAALSKYPELGPGLVSRVVRSLQREFLRPPSGHEAGLMIHGS
jgi:hypothetical protein